MSVNEIVHHTRDLLAGWELESRQPTENRVDVPLPVAQLREVAERLSAQWGYLIAITGLDNGPEDGQFEVLYHFGQGPVVLTLRVLIPRMGGVLPSLSELVPAAADYERELREMFGITIEGLDAPPFLFLPDDWPTDVYPLRKDFEPPEKPAAKSLGEAL